MFERAFLITCATYRDSEKNRMLLTLKTFFFLARQLLSLK